MQCALSSNKVVQHALVNIFVNQSCYFLPIFTLFTKGGVSGEN
jgi:hypothetical protein